MWAGCWIVTFEHHALSRGSPPGDPVGAQHREGPPAVLLVVGKHDTVLLPVSGGGLYPGAGRQERPARGTVHDVALLSLPCAQSARWSPAVSLTVLPIAHQPTSVLAVPGRHPAPGSSQPDGAEGVRGDRMARRPGAGALVTTVPAAPVAAHPEPSPFLDPMYPDRMGNSAPELGGCPAAGNVPLPRARAAYGVRLRDVEEGLWLSLIHISEPTRPY